MGGCLEDLKLLIRTRHALVTIQTPEEAYAARMIREAAREMGLAAMEWSISDGLRRVLPDDGGQIAGTESLVGALKFMRSNDAMLVYVLKDALRLLSDATAERLLRDVAREFCPSNRTAFMIDAGGELPSALYTLAVPYELSLPDEKEILDTVLQAARQLSQYVGDKGIRMTKADLDRFLFSLRGLTRMEVAQVVGDCILGKGQLDASAADQAVEVKRHRLRQTGVLDYIPPPQSPPDVGGMANLRQWLAQRAGAFTPEARAYGLDMPRGILMLGVQGCGKSIMARYVAAQWRMPLLRMDVGALYDKYVGESERHLRTAFQVANAMAPCVLWMDEIEKAFASAGAGADGAISDGGLSQRMFGQLLTWMQDRPSPVFIVATANDVTALPPELMRKGRFDEVFFVDLPDQDARKDVFRIHLSKRKRDPGQFDLPALAKAAEGFSGAEIEQVIVGAMYAAFAQKRELAGADLLKELSATRPLSVVMAEKVQALRTWADGRCVKAD